ncbi:hypothetical protein ACQKJG_17835 [Priestia megaterium]|uniref:hypothetical protein n=1 Tax=Priestia megaterium TaxID=1404 RepID=UPI003CFE089C
MPKFGDWIKGPFKSATIEAFVIEEIADHLKIIVKKIERFDASPIPGLEYGSVHILPKEMIQKFYVMFSEEQQKSLVELALSLNEIDWHHDLLQQFVNPFEKVIQANRTIVKERTGVDLIYSQTLSTLFELGQESKEKLYSYYQEAIAKGISPFVTCASDINNTAALDNTIASIVFVSKNEEGIKYIRTLIKNS